MELNKELLEKMDNTDKLELLDLLEKNLLKTKTMYDKMVRETYSGVYDYSIIINDDKEVIKDLEKKISLIKEFTDLEQNIDLEM